jgi:hypothetical protein
MHCHNDQVVTCEISKKSTHMGKPHWLKEISKKNLDPERADAQGVPPSKEWSDPLGQTAWGLMVWEDAV